LRQSTALVVATCLLYSILVIVSLVEFIDYVQINLHQVQHPSFWLFQRMGQFLVVCALSIYLAHYRTTTQRILVHIQEILAKLPAPVVISDASGYITYANEALAMIFRKKASQLTGKRYIDFLMPDIQEGKAMRYYIEIFGDETNAVHELEVRPLDNHTVKARLTCLGSGSNRVLVTAFDVLQVPPRVDSATPARSIAQPADR
jgi:PAS domain-containing protein